MTDAQIVHQTFTEVQQEALAEINGALAVWIDSVRMMRTLDKDFAKELATCRSAAEAIESCSRWTEHRLDSLFALQCRMLEIWLTCASRTALDVSVPTINGRHRSDPQTDNPANHHSPLPAKPLTAA